MGDYAVHREVTEGREGVKKERESSRPGESHKGKILIFIFHGREGGVRIGRCGTSPVSAGSSVLSLKSIRKA